jgi:hypothetical protein
LVNGSYDLIINVFITIGEVMLDILEADKLFMLLLKMPRRGAAGAVALLDLLFDTALMLSEVLLTFSKSVLVE